MNMQRTLVCPCCGLRQHHSEACQLCFTSFDDRDLEVAILRSSRGEPHCSLMEDSFNRINSIKNDIVNSVISSPSFNRAGVVNSVGFLASGVGEGEVSLPDATGDYVAAIGHLRDLCYSTSISMEESERRLLFQWVVDDVLGLGPLGQLLRDSSVEVIHVNSPDDIFITYERPVSLSFLHEDHLAEVATRLVEKLGGDLNRDCVATARFPNGWIVEATLSPISPEGTTLTILKNREIKMKPEELETRKVLSAGMLQLLKNYILLGRRIVISGSVGSAKQTLLNSLMNLIPPSRRVVAIELGVENLLLLKHSVRLRVCEHLPNGGAAELVSRACARDAERIVLSECCGNEALNLLEAMAAGTTVMTTVTSASPGACLRRLERMVRAADPALSAEVARQIVADGVQVIVQINRLEEGTRRVVEISELHGLDNGQFSLCPIYRANFHGLDKRGFFRASFEKVGASRFDTIETDMCTTSVDQQQSESDVACIP